jgi:hypothetical protein
MKTTFCLSLVLTYSFGRLNRKKDVHEVDFWNSAEVGIFSESFFPSPESLGIPRNSRYKIPRNSGYKIFSGYDSFSYMSGARVWVSPGGVPIHVYLHIHVYIHFRVRVCTLFVSVSVVRVRCSYPCPCLCPSSFSFDGKGTKKKT